jgi:hypothetical protein
MDGSANEGNSRFNLDSATAKEHLVKLRRKTRLVLEQLEDRLTPASFNLFYSGGNLTIMQSAALSGATDTLNITDNVTANMIVLTDAGAGGTTTDVPVAGVTNVTLNLLPNAVAATTRTISYDLGAAGRAGNLTLNLSSGPQSLDINDNGGTGPVGGNLTVNAGPGSDTITAAASGTLSVGQSFNITLGSGTQTVTLGNTAIGNNLNFNTTTAVDAISLGGGPGQAFTVAGNVNIFTGTGNNTLTMGFVGIGTATVSGNLYATGISFFSLGSGSAIVGNATFNAGVKPLSYTFNTGSSVGGSVSISNQGGIPLASSSLSFAGTIGNNLAVSLGNTAGDSVSLTGAVGGNMNVTGGSSGKTVSLSSTASVGKSFTALLGNGIAGANIVSITGGAQVGQNIYASLGNTTNAGGNLLDLSGALVGGSVTVQGGSGADTYKSSSSADTVNGPTFIGGSVYMNLGAGPNSATVSGTVGGPSISYLSGPGNDTVLIDAASFASIYINLFVASPGTTKSVTLGVRPRSAFIDFGFGSGTKTLTLTGTATPVTYPLTVLNK